MKNIYELSKQDKDKYRDEFNKQKFTKHVNIVRDPSLFVALVAAVVCFFIWTCRRWYKTSNIDRVYWNYYSSIIWFIFRFRSLFEYFFHEMDENKT